MKLTTCFSMLNRREWLKVLLLGSVANTGFGQGIVDRIRSQDLGSAGNAEPDSLSIAAQLTPRTNNSMILPIRISEFSGLSEIGGSVAIYFSNFSYPIVINRADTDVFHAIDPTCSHQGCQVETYIPAAFAMECPCHGSLFSIEGKVISGPAQFDLSTFPSRFDGVDLLEVELGLPFRIDRVTVQSNTGANLRLRLDFPGVAGCKYLVRYYADLAAQPQPALFSLSAAGAANQSSFTVPHFIAGNPLSGDGPKSLWVDAPGTTGFFALEMALGLSTPL